MRPHGTGPVLRQGPCGLWELVRSRPRGRESSRVEDSSSDGHRNYSAPLTHRPRNRRIPTEGWGVGEEGGSPSMRTLATKPGIVLQVQSSSGDVSAMKINWEKSLGGSWEFGCGCRGTADPCRPLPVPPRNPRNSHSHILSASNRFLAPFSAPDHWFFPPLLAGDLPANRFWITGSTIQRSGSRLVCNRDNSQSPASEKLGQIQIGLCPSQPSFRPRGVS